MADNWNFEGLTKDVLIKFDENPCCCEDISFPDNSKIENPKNPISIISKEFIETFETYLKQLNIVEIAYVNEIKDYFLHDLNFNFKSAILISYEISEKIHKVGAGMKAQEYNDDLYYNFGNLTYKISDYLRTNGFETMVAHPREETVDFSHLAEKAGMGAIGRSGLLISPNKGPNQKIAAILVNIDNLPVVEYNPHLWISEYCNRCNSCIKKCPQNAFIHNKTNNTFEFIEELCIGCSKGCTECIKVCPFYKKGYGHMLIKFKKIKAKTKKQNQ